MAAPASMVDGKYHGAILKQTVSTVSFFDDDPYTATELSPERAATRKINE
jgi:hypothetical protein